MSEYERQQQDLEDDLLNVAEDAFPDDFSEEDIAFAQELGSLFDAEQEEIPPYFTQTLLEADGPRFREAEEAFEQKTSARVFRRLKLHRQLFRSSHLTGLRLAFPSRRFLAILTVMLLMMGLTMFFTISSFASGLAILLAGPSSGVIQVHSHPQAKKPTTVEEIDQMANAAPASEKYISIETVQKLLHFSMYFPQDKFLPDQYALRDIYLYTKIDQSWASGPILEVNYTDPSVGPGNSPVNRLVIYQFKPVGRVLQLVEYGAAHTMMIDPDGKQSGVYVDGTWDRNHVWVYNNRVELITERDGVVFWIIGDQRAGFTEKALRKIAASLQTYPVDVRYNRIIQSFEDAPAPLRGQVIYLDNPNDPSGPTIKILGEPSQQSDRNHPDDPVD
jgi:hypothetical protein